MRCIIFLLTFFSFNAYSALRMEGTAGMPCVGTWEPFEYFLCPVLTTTAIPLAIIVAPTGITMYAGSSTDKKNKYIINNKNNAASYVASNGEINSAYLEQAFIILRKEYPNTSDMELAKAILAY